MIGQRELVGRLFHFNSISDFCFRLTPRPTSTRWKSPTLLIVPHAFFGPIIATLAADAADRKLAVGALGAQRRP